MNQNVTRLIIGITGASGALYGIRMLKALQNTAIQTHLIISKSAHLTITQETNLSIDEVKALADETHSHSDIAACIASGSFQTLGMIIAPCSIRTMGEIASSTTSNLLTRAADVCLKDRRKLVMMVRETPLHAIHLEQMHKLAQAGAIIAPPVPAFYSHPETINEMVDHTVGRVLDLFGIDHTLVKRWDGLSVNNR